MNRIIPLLLINLLCFFNIGFTQIEIETAQCYQQGSAPSLPSSGGLYITAQGNLNILFVYVQFSDDKYDTTNTYWQKGSAPVYIDDTIDSIWSTNPTPGGFTDYFNQMSFETFRVTGVERSVITPHSRAWYLAKGWERDSIHMDVLQALDVSFDFTNFDKWKNTGDYVNSESSDNVVDMVVMMWRNIFSDTVSSVGPDLGLEPGGIATLGKLTTIPEIDVDGGSRKIKMGYGVGAGSGITVIQPTSSNLSSSVFWQYARHEFGHVLLGASHPVQYTYGLLSNWGSPGDVMNSYEREKLNWISFNTTITDVSSPRTIPNIELEDYVTTGDVFRIKVPGGVTDEYFLIENHQKISNFDKTDYNFPEVKGLYVIHQRNKYIWGSTIISAEGKFNWDVIGMKTNPGGVDLPVFKRGTPNRVSGYDRRKNIPWSYSGNSDISQITYQLINGEIKEPPPAIYRGTGNDQFTINYNNVFTPFSNPGSDIHSYSDKIGFEITNDANGVYTLNVYINNTDQTSPSKPQSVAANFISKDEVEINWDSNLETDISGYDVYRSVYWNGGSLSYSKVNTSLVTSNSFNDTPPIPTGVPANVDVYYRYYVKAKDNQGKYSVPSDDYWLLGAKTVSGTISSATWDGRYIVLGDISINSGNTLEINEGATIFLANYADITVNGTIIAQGTSSDIIDFKKYSSSHWGNLKLNGDNNTFENCVFDDPNYIKLNSSSGNTFEDCVVKNAYLAFWLNDNSDVYIKNCKIFNNSNVINFSSTNDVWLTGNEIHDNGAYGIYSPSANVISLYGNVIENNPTAGIYATSGSVVQIGKPYSWAGYNTIRNNRDGAYEDNDIIVAGSGTDVDLTYACVYSNSCCTSGYEIKNQSSTDHMFVQSSWYGSDGVLQYTGDLAFGSPLASEPGWCGEIDDNDPSQYFPKMSIITDVIPDKYLGRFGLNSLKEKLLDETIPIAEKPTILSDIYSMLREDYRKNQYGEKDKFFDFLKNKVMKINDFKVQNLALQFMVTWKTLAGDYNQAIEISEELLSRLNNEDMMSHFYNLLGLFQNLGKDTESDQVLNTLIAEYGVDKPEIALAIEDMGMPDPKVGKYVVEHVDEQIALAIPSEFSISQNFPNPFNPVTKIEYGLPEDSHVSLKIYNIQGKMVEELVNGYKQAGLYNASFNGGNLASGIYFYRLEAVEKGINGKRFVQTKRMLLVK